MVTRPGAAFCVFLMALAKFQEWISIFLQPEPVRFNFLVCTGSAEYDPRFRTAIACKDNPLRTGLLIGSEKLWLFFAGEHVAREFDRHESDDEYCRK
jgi:hypothetical protein